MSERPSHVSCWQCQHFQTSWDKNFPYLCKQLNFKSKYCRALRFDSLLAANAFHFLLKCKTLNPAKITLQIVTFNRINEATRYLVLAIGVGAATSAIANLFIQGEAIFGVAWQFYGTPYFPELAENIYWVQGIALFIGAN